MIKKDLLFEIGVEELPAGYIRIAMESLIRNLTEALNKANLLSTEIVEYSTPRRLAVCLKSLPFKQEDEIVEKVGPASRIAYDAEGNLTKAGEGFLVSSGVTVESLKIKSTPKGDYIAADVHIKGEDTYILLQNILPEIIKKINFPKAMYWNSKNITFARPVRWLVALFGNQIVDLDFDGVQAGQYTYGNVFTQEAEKVLINEIGDYERLLESQFVICDREKRKKLIKEQLDRLAESLNGEINYTGGLLDEVTDIVEYPTAVIAEFAEEYLKLPGRVINSTLAKNQKYFSLYSQTDQQLLQNFIFVANNHPDYASNTRAGNERVVKARLDDAVFYFAEDLQRSIDYFNERLTRMVFHASLGTIWEKEARIVKIASQISDELKLSAETKSKIVRGASICKFDLATNMVAEKEFTGLQGYVGMNYALHFGEDPEVAQAVEEHYLPLSFNDKIPQSVTGIVVSLADKIDTLCGIFGIDKIPTGSNDPFALRRAGNGIIRIIYEKELPLDLSALVDTTYALLNDRLSEQDKNKAELLSFFKQRIEWLLDKKGIDYDIINAVVGGNFTEVILLKKKVEALQLLRNRNDFVNLVLSFKRVSNIIAQEQNFADLVPELLQENAEKELYDALLDLEKTSKNLLEKQDYSGLLESFILIKDSIDLFFDKVLVNVEDKKIRDNRYALLNRIRTLFLQVGDLSLIVIEGEK